MCFARARVCRQVCASMCARLYCTGMYICMRALCNVLQACNHAHSNVDIYAQAYAYVHRSMCLHSPRGRIAVQGKICTQFGWRGWSFKVDGGKLWSRCGVEPTSTPRPERVVNEAVSRAPSLRITLHRISDNGITSIFCLPSFVAQSAHGRLCHGPYLDSAGTWYT